MLASEIPAKPGYTIVIKIIIDLFSILREIIISISQLDNEATKQYERSASQQKALETGANGLCKDAAAPLL